MTAPGTEHVDAVVVGASIRGLVTAHVLDALGYRAVVVERGASLGGADGSFVTAGGSLFDFGLHVLDHCRSELATRLFTRAVDGKVHRQHLRRAIVLRNHVMPYNPAPAEMPDELRTMLRGDSLIDDLGAETPTRERLAGCYGAAFADLIFDEVLPSYPTEHRHRAFGVDESLLLTNIYPWFFPRAERRYAGGDASRRFHDRLRDGQPQEILYPTDGGFAGFARGIADKLDPARVELITGATDLECAVRPGTHQLAAVTAGGRRFTADHVFWAAPWPALCRLLGIACQDAATDRVMLGSFRLDAPAHTGFHELLVGDPQARLNRVSLPGSLRGSGEALLQVEFAVPVAGDWPTDAEVWQEIWTEDLHRLGLLTAEHGIEDYDFRAFPMHFNAFGCEGEPLRDADLVLIDPAGNVRPVVPSMANLNLNGHVAATVAYVTSVLAGS